MNKDALLATLIGFGIGLLITGLLLVGPNVLKLLPPINFPKITLFQSKQNTPIPTPTPKAPVFAIESPLPETIENSSDLLVTGTAPSGSVVVIAGSVDETAVSVGSDGKFAGKITLGEGKNDITVTALTAGKATDLTVTVYYTEENV